MGSFFVKMFEMLLEGNKEKDNLHYFISNPLFFYV